MTEVDILVGGTHLRVSSRRLGGLLSSSEFLRSYRSIWGGKVFLYIPVLLLY